MLYDNQEGVWRTIRGRRIFIPEGASVEESFKQSLQISKVFENVKDMGYIKVDKVTYSRLANIIGTYPKKYVKGEHLINLDNVIYITDVKTRMDFGVLDYCNADDFDELIELFGGKGR